MPSSFSGTPDATVAALDVLTNEAKFVPPRPDADAPDDSDEVRSRDSLHSSRRFHRFFRGVLVGGFRK